MRGDNFHLGDYFDYLDHLTDHLFDSTDDDTARRDNDDRRVHHHHGEPDHHIRIKHYHGAFIRFSGHDHDNDPPCTETH